MAPRAHAGPAGFILDDPEHPRSGGWGVSPLIRLAPRVDRHLGRSTYANTLAHDQDSPGHIRGIETSPRFKPKDGSHHPLVRRIVEAYVGTCGNTSAGQRAGGRSRASGPRPAGSL